MYCDEPSESRDVGYEQTVVRAVCCCLNAERAPMRIRCAEHTEIDVL